MAALSALAFAMPAAAKDDPAIGCPLRDQPYSSESPLIHLMLKPEAVAVIEHDAPGMIAHIWSASKSVTVPSFGSIVTLRHATGSNSPSEDVWATIDRD